MKKISIALGVLLVGAVVAFAFVNNSAPADKKSSDTPQAAEGTITWMNWDDAVKAAEKNKKKVFVDCYTDWCGWCKKMDASTFKDPEVVAYMNKHFYAVKFNAEQKEPITWRGNTFNYFDGGGRRGVHQLAYSLLDGRLGYPSFVYLDENFDRVTISPGFKDPNGLMQELKWVAEGHFKTQSFQEYSGQ